MYVFCMSVTIGARLRLRPSPNKHRCVDSRLIDPFSYDRIFNSGDEDGIACVTVAVTPHPFHRVHLVFFWTRSIYHVIVDAHTKWLEDFRYEWLHHFTSGNR